MTASWVRDESLPTAESSGNHSSNSSSNSNSNSNSSNIQSNNANLCSYYENFDARRHDLPILRGIYTLDRIKEYGRKSGLCPYFLTRYLINHADIIVYNYQYMLDPKVYSVVC